MSFIFQLKPLCSPFWPVLETRLLLRKGWDREYVFLTMPGSVTKIYQTGLDYGVFPLPDSDSYTDSYSDSYEIGFNKKCAELFPLNLDQFLFLFQWLLYPSWHLYRYHFGGIYLLKEWKLLYKPVEIITKQASSGSMEAIINFLNKVASVRDLHKNHHRNRSQWNTSAYYQNWYNNRNNRNRHWSWAVETHHYLGGFNSAIHCNSLANFSLQL